MKKRIRITSFLLAIAVLIAIALPAMAVSSGFTDVPSTHWAYSYIEEMAEKGIMEGVGNNRFNPTGKISVAEFAAMLVRAFYPGVLSETQTSAQIMDNANMWYGPYITAAHMTSLLVMTSAYMEFLNNDHMYRNTTLTGSMTRYDMARMIYQLIYTKNSMYELDLPTDSEQAAAQKKIQDWSSVPQNYQTPVAVCYAMGFLNGNEKGQFAGSNSMTRAEAATVMSRLLAYGIQPDTYIDKPTTPTPDPTPAPSAGADLQTYRNEVLRLVNEERAKVGAAPLTLNEKLCEAAQLRANEITTLFSHTRPDGSECFTALKGTGLTYRTAGENIAAGQSTPASVMNAWMNSSGHKANILNNSFSSIGIGFVKTDTGYGYYWVQMFIG